MEESGEIIENKTKSLFLCHSAKDKDFAHRLATDLNARGIGVWIDEAEMRIGDSLIGKIEEAIDQVDCLGVVLSPDSVSSEWVLKEVRIALHTEFAGKRLIVIPLLYRNCELPSFLLDKACVDFRNPSNYGAAVQEVIRYVHHDFFDEPESAALREHVETLPLTKLWRRALATDAYSTGLLLQFRKELHGMGPELDAPDILTSVSYTLFLSQMLMQGSISEGQWDFLCRLVEDTEIPGWLRYWTLDRLVGADPREPACDPIRIPNVCLDETQPEIDNPLFLCISEFFDHKGFDTILRDRNGPQRILAYVWRRGEDSVRGRLMSALQLYVQRQGQDSYVITEPLQTILDCDDQEQVERVLDEVYSRWVLSKAEGTLERERYRASHGVERLLNHANTTFVEELIGLFRGASQRSPDERYDFEVYVSLARLFEPQTFRLLRERQGERSTYSLLTELIVDELVDLEFSCLALQALVTEFGVEGLLLDDRLPDGLFVRRGRDPHRYSVVDICCEGINLSAEAALMWGFTLLAFHNVLEEYHRSQLLNTVAKHANASARGRVVLDLLEGRLSPDAFECTLESPHV